MLNREALAPAMKITLTPAGFLCASNRSGEADDPTHYDAVWVRDSMWAYLALRLHEKNEAKRVLDGMMRYFASRAQLQRLHAVIGNPSLAKDAMKVLHIRFDSRSETMDDVRVNGEPQRWNHKQNDAVGFFYACAVEALDAGELHPDANEWEVLTRLPEYFEAIRFWEMEDAGAWEEIERVNTSSIALVTWSLETAAKSPALRAKLDGARLKRLVDLGYERIFRQLPFESPLHPKTGAKYREADAALLNVIYPARLSRITREHGAAILRTIQPLIGEKGIARYLGDSYQSGNYWLAPPAAGVEDERTADFSAEEDFQRRTDRMIPGTEAQWFFDSWVSKVCGMLGMRDEQEKFFNRAVGQLTSGETGADGKPVPAFALPESWNTIVEDGKKRFAPSPITPLNWAKCSLLLALDELRARPSDPIPAPCGSRPPTIETPASK